MSRQNTQQKLTDTDKMPFGKYGPLGEQRMMQDVPARYLHFLWINGLSQDKDNPVAAYIKENLDALARENPDAIWD